MKHLDAISLEDLVDPLGGFLLVVPVFTHGIVALLITLDLIWDVKGISGFLHVEIVGHGTSIDLLRLATWMVFDPRSILSECVSSLVSFLNSADVN